MSTSASEIKNAVEAAVVDVKNLETRVRALENQAAGYVHSHIPYIVGAICLVVGAVAGHFLR